MSDDEDSTRKQSDNSPHRSSGSSIGSIDGKYLGTVATTTTVALAAKNAKVRMESQLAPTGASTPASDISNAPEDVSIETTSSAASETGEGFWETVGFLFGS